MSAGPRRGRTEFPEVAIRTDAEGRYCLNDLHKAAGNEKRHQPSDWLSLQQTSGLIAEISNSGDSRSCDPTDSKAGRNGGTYVCRGAQEIR